MKRFFLLGLLLLSSAKLFAVPAYPEKIRFTQPQSEVTVTIYLMGDERVHWAETEDGYSLLHGDNGALYFATKDASGDMVVTEYLACDEQERTEAVKRFLKDTPKHLRFSNNQIEAMLNIWKYVEDAKKGPKAMTNVLGDKKFLVILFGFNDKDFQYGILDFKRLFNQVNYSLNGATGSVRDYYTDVSHGLFSLHVDVVGPFIGVENTAFYGNSDYGYQYFAREAVDSAAKYVDFSDYDNDGDGYIDGLHIIFAGFGEEAGASSDCIWSHKWNIFDAPTYNNTVVDVYSCSPELSGHIGNDMTHIGVICHELGHVFGAPDYYDTDYGSSGGEYPGLGKWDIMSGGSWNQGGLTPAHHNPYTKIYIYHWADCDTLNNKEGAYVMHPVDETNNDFYRINTSTPGDYFLIENRQKIKWDRMVPGHGMLVYHVGPSVHGSRVHNYSHPQDIYILASSNDTFPNASPSSYGTVNGTDAAFPASNNRRDSLTDNSVPWFRPWSKQANGQPIYNISENSTEKCIYFTLLNAQPEPTAVQADELSNDIIGLSWKRYGGYNTMIVMSETDVFGVPSGTYNVGDSVDGGGVVVYRGTGTTTAVNGLERNKRYYFKVFSNWRQNHYSNGVTATAKTLDCETGEWAYEDFESTESGELPECWSGTWTVDSVDGSKVLRTPNDSTGEGLRWISANSAPIVYDTPKGVVMKFSYMMGDGCDESTQMNVALHRSVENDWETLQTYEWHFGQARWNEVYLHLGNIGDYSRIRFSAYGTDETEVAIDDITLTEGALVLAQSDANGNISPRGYSIVAPGETKTFTIKPLNGYQLKRLTLNGAALSPSIYSTDSNQTTTLTLSGLTNSNTLMAEFEPTVGIESIETQPLKVYPNPTEGVINVSVKAGDEVVVYNALGQIIIKKTSDGEVVSLDLSEAARGIYLVRCGGRTAKIVRK